MFIIGPLMLYPCDIKQHGDNLVARHSRQRYVVTVRSSHRGTGCVLSEVTKEHSQRGLLLSV